MESYFSGVIEGFYGRPWRWDERCYLIENLSRWNLNTYMYAPKFDLHHRLMWDQPYESATCDQFTRLLQKGLEQNVTVIVSLSPGLSIDLDQTSHFSTLLAKIQSFRDMGASSIGLLMDDIPYKRADGSKHAELANKVLHYFNGDIQLFFCPTAYSGWHIETWPGATEYLQTLGGALDASISIFWTGPTIISRHISSVDLIEINEMLHRKIIIWDNYFATDYLPAHTVFTGPFMDRSHDILPATSGLLLNPSQYFHLNLLPIMTFGDFIHHKSAYQAQDSWTDSIASHFNGDNEPLETILGYFYSPYSISDKWEKRLERIRQFVLNQSTSSPVDELRSIKASLHEDLNLVKYGPVWDELFPFVQTLNGDIDYVIKLLTEFASSPATPLTVLPGRDPRWSTPLITCLQSIMNDMVK